MSLELIWDTLHEEWKRQLDRTGDFLEAKPLPKANRGSWFCPVVDPLDARTLKKFLDEKHLSTVYDMGAGDLRLSYWLAEEGFHVIAYETLREMPFWAQRVMGPATFEIRYRDYYKDFRRLIKTNHCAFAFFGGANRPPWISDQLIAEGYFEKGTRFWFERKKILEY